MHIACCLREPGIDCGNQKFREKKIDIVREHFWLLRERNKEIRQEMESEKDFSR